MQTPIFVFNPFPIPLLIFRYFSNCFSLPKFILSNNNSLVLNCSNQNLLFYLKVKIPVIYNDCHCLFLVMLNLTFKFPLVNVLNLLFFVKLFLFFDTAKIYGFSVSCFQFRSNTFHFFAIFE